MQVGRHIHGVRHVLQDVAYVLDLASQQNAMKTYRGMGCGTKTHGVIWKFTDATQILARIVSTSNHLLTLN